MARLFISQERLDAWSAEQRVSLDGDIMTLADDGRSFKVQAAVRFLSVSGGDPDAKELVGTVRTEADLLSMEAEHYLTSVICGDVAYDVQQGFLGEPLARQG